MRLAYRLLTPIAAALLLLLASAPSARAGDLVGLRAGPYTRTGRPYAGFELLLPIGNRVYLNPNVEYVFVPSGTHMTFNADFHYDFPTRGRTYFWAGSGLAVLYTNPEGPAGGSSDLGLDLIFGVGYKAHVVPYVQAKVIVKNDTELVLGFGLRF